MTTTTEVTDNGVPHETLSLDAYVDWLTERIKGKTVHGPGSNFWEDESGWCLEVEFQARKHEGHKARQFTIRMCQGNAKKKADPGKAKQLGRKWKLTPQELKAWDARKLEVMRELMAEKVQRSPEFREWLKNTGTQLIVEGNWWHDNFWGNCRCVNQDGKHPECKKAGKNWLGHVLMDARRMV